MTKFSHFALIQYGYSIYGVGKTVKQARANAAQWLDNKDGAKNEIPEGKLNSSTRIDGSLIIVPCTTALAAAVAEHGGAIKFDEIEGGICLPEEAE